LVDDDLVCLTNLNRQILATHATVGRAKVDVAEERIHAICPDTVVVKHRCFFLPETADRFDFSLYDYVVDAVDTVTAKLELVVRGRRARAAGVPFISCMGAGNKVDAGRFRVADLYDTQVCPLARVMRRELRRRGVTQLTVVYSDEEPLTPKADADCSCEGHCVCPPDAPRTCATRRAVPGSTPFAPAIAGFLIGGEVINRLAAEPDEPGS
jgi:tRNA A37 threonylcarbamoyladenosine dehydratase